MLEQAAEEVAKSVRAMVSTSKEDGKNSETARQALLDSISKLQQLVLRPDEALTQMVVQHQQLASIYWLSHFGIPALIPASPQSAGYADVAAAAKVPEKRLISIARMAMTANFLAETDAGQLVHTELSEAFVEADSHYRNWMTFVVRRVVPAMHKMVEATEKWSETNTGNQTAYTLAMDTDKSFFEHINSTPELAKEIGGYMRSRSVITPQSGVDGLIENFDWKSLGNGLVVDVSVRDVGPISFGSGWLPLLVHKH